MDYTVLYAVRLRFVGIAEKTIGQGPGLCEFTGANFPAALFDESVSISVFAKPLIEIKEKAVSEVNPESHMACMNRFIDLANTMKDEGVDIKIVSSALMAASAVYATFIFRGNEGGLTDSGVDKVTDAYRKHLNRVQEMRKAEDDARRSSSDS